MSAVDQRGGTALDDQLAPLLCELALTAITDAVTGICDGRIGANVHYRMLAHHVPLTSVMVRRVRDCVDRIPVLGEVPAGD